GLPDQRYGPADNGVRPPARLKGVHPRLSRPGSTERAAAPAARVAASPAGPPRAESLAEAVYARVRDKLTQEPVEDYRIDFEDGYGNRSDAEEDGHAVQTDSAMAKG